jgi:hypothetical protein
VLMSMPALMVDLRGQERFFSRPPTTLAAPFNSSTATTGRDVSSKSAKTGLPITRWAAVAEVALAASEHEVALAAASVVVEALAAAAEASVVALEAVVDTVVVWVALEVLEQVAMMLALLSRRHLPTRSPTSPPRALRRTRSSTSATYVLWSMDNLY